ncbi:unnamed protein product, partial [Tenebrio molitor]
STCVVYLVNSIIKRRQRCNRILQSANELATLCAPETKKRKCQFLLCYIQSINCLLVILKKCYHFFFMMLYFTA